MTWSVPALSAALMIGACAHPPSAPLAPNARAAARVAFDEAGVGRAAATGLAAPGRSATTADPVRVASVSKLFVAMAVMRFVERGTLALDRDVSDDLGWPLRNPAHPDQPVTLRQLLSHTSSLTDAGDYIVPLGQTMQTFVSAKSWDAAHPPGTFFRYSNLNYGIIGTILERVSGERFDRLMRREVLEPMRVDAGFNWSGVSDAGIARAVVLRAPDGSVRRDDLQGRRPDCPVVPAADGSCELDAYRPGDNGALFSPQGGLRISVEGLARAGRMLIGRGRLDDVRFLSEASIAAMVAPVWRFDGGNGDTEGGFYCAFGLGVMLISNDARCRDNPFNDGRARFGHAGEAYNLRSALWIDPADGTGAAWFVTAVADDAAGGRSAYTREEEQLAAAVRRP
jgi:CubicO group peptidase (beta-lactamase class C family)